MATVITIINYDCTVITIVNYDPKTFIVQATGQKCGQVISSMTRLISMKRLRINDKNDLSSSSLDKLACLELASRLL